MPQNYAGVAACSAEGFAHEGEIVSSAVGAVRLHLDH
jgi:hypothetical protein